ncbi:ectoine synthase [Woeseia oceani]|uniref:L-ectoine synthase n=1 Tax=Woeseia oceani TaxID=1548547 RepID=A0A193LCU0_9GAMM|nr:ectoine synthase [Woeseia oceani]ANO50261.1 L-ectoine synthase [Woeseia oceani]
MIIRDYNEAKNTSRKVEAEGWTSVRLLLKEDGMGFSFHITTIHAGAELPMHYQRHLESVYCMSGKGSIESRLTGEVTQIRPGICYALDQHDPHILRAEEEMQMACVFNPPVTGTEVHDASGAYPLPADDA